METEIRKVTGRYNPSQMPSSLIKTYFNRYYTLHFPQEYKFLKLKAAFVAVQHSLLKYNMFSLIYRIVVEPMPVPDSPVQKFKRK